MLFGAGCAARPVIDPGECVPDVIVQERMVEIPAELTLPQPCPDVPDEGSVRVLLDWMENCAISARMANDQLTAIRKLQD